MAFILLFLFSSQVINLPHYVEVLAILHTQWLSCACLFATPWTVACSVHGVVQARILGPVAISSSRGSS